MSDDETKKDETTEETARPRRSADEAAGRGVARLEAAAEAEEAPAEEAPRRPLQEVRLRR